MITHPRQQIIVRHGARRNTQANSGNFLVCAVHPNTVDLQEGQHHIHTNTFVSINKCVIGNEGIAQSSALFLLGWIKLFPSKSGKCTFQSRFQQCFVTDADAAARFLSNQLMEKQYFFF